MSSSITSTTLYCFRCQHYPEPDDEPLKRCGRCRLRRYCSRECQRNDWPDHKAECRIIAAGGQAPPRSRTTMRFTMGRGGGASAERDAFGEMAEPDTIYYTRTSKPHLRDISISGPYHSLEMVLYQLLHRLEIEGSIGGRDTLEEIVNNGQLGAMVHLNAPLPDGSIMKLEILHEKNAEVARILPGAVWMVVVATPDMSAESRHVFDEPVRGHRRVLDTDVHKTFRTLEEANREGRRALQEFKEELGDEAIIEERVNNGMVSGFVMSPRITETKIVEVRSDNGRTVDMD